MPNEIVRAEFPALDLRVADTGQRIVEGIVVPWDEVTYLTADPMGERFLKGSLSRTVRERGQRIKLFRGHDHTYAVGRAVSWNTSDERGLFGTFRLAETPDGDAALAEAREGMLDTFSVGFRPVRTKRGDDGAREIVEAALHEVSLTPMGAYDGAQVLAMRTPDVEQSRPVVQLDLPAMPDVNLDPIPPVAHWA